MVGCASVVVAVVFGSAMPSQLVERRQSGGDEVSGVEEVVEERTTTTKRKRRIHNEEDDGTVPEGTVQERVSKSEAPVVRRRGRPLGPTTLDGWSRDARFFVGSVGGLAFPPDALGPAGAVGIELGVAATKGFGFGMHMLALGNPPAVPMLKLPKAAYGFGAAADLRWYIQTIEPLTLYPAVSVGFAAGPAEETGRNAVLPLLNAGFGARMIFGQLYVALGLGVSGLFVPFLNVSVGWTPTRDG